MNYTDLKIDEDTHIENAFEDSFDEDFLSSESDYEDDDLAIDVAENLRKILWQAKDFSIREFLSMKNDGELILQPEYQRNFVITPKIASKLIESVLLDVPIPVIYLAEESDGTFSVIDGQQRLTTFISFLEGKYPNNKPFKLSGLNVHPELNRKGFVDLSSEQQKKIRSATLHTILIKKESNADIKFEIFQRLNTGSTKLNENEIRNNLYRGSYNDLLKTLAGNPKFHKLIQNDNLKKRMGYEGLILRFLSLSERSYLNYRSPMKQFINKELRENQNLSKTKAKEFKEKFEHCLDLVDCVFSDKAFRKYIFKQEDLRSGWVMNQINAALFEVQMCGFVNYSKNQVLSKADYIREGLLDLLINNQQFVESISVSTGNTETLRKRFKIYMSMLESIIESPSQRFFPFSVKKTLFDQNPICAISGQTILKIEDAEVDHIIPFSKGGKTEIENAQLVLRYFNRSKGSKYENDTIN